jgi:hypothetical protein
MLLIFALRKLGATVGPIALFDKSFLQSLSLDESVWFDHFFIPVVSPIFFIETLADLAKQHKDGARSPEDVVRIIADKTPILSGAPCVHHATLCIANLLGDEAPQYSQIPIAGARPVRSSEGKTGAVFQNSLEYEAFERWQQGKFLELERDIASKWRANLSEIDLAETASRMRELGVTRQKCRSVKEAFGIAAGLAHSNNKPEHQLRLLFSFIHVPLHLQEKILHRWSVSGYPPLASFASYAAHVFTVELFFQISLAANLISAERPSNRADIAYLFYLPFCHVFISGDKLHRLCVPEFLRKEQEFVWAPELKGDLARINKELMATSEVEREVGLHKLAPFPPGDQSSMTVNFLKKYAPGLSNAESGELSISPEAGRKLSEYVKSFASAPTDLDVALIPSNQLDGITIERRLPAKKGSWWIIPKAIADAEDREA